MLSVQVTCVLVLSLISAVTALQCFACEDCVNCIGKPVNCTGDADTCMEAKIDGHIGRRCVEAGGCALATATNWMTNKFLNKVNILFTGKGIKGSKGTNQVHCCNEDFCNGPSRNEADYEMVMSKSYCCKEVPQSVVTRMWNYFSGSGAEESAILMPYMLFMAAIMLLL